MGDLQNKLENKVRDKAGDAISKIGGDLTDGLLKGALGKLGMPSTKAEAPPNPNKTDPLNKSDNPLDSNYGNIDVVALDESIDQILERLPMGSMTKAIGNNLYGFNFRNQPNAAPIAKDNYGYVFFTRPQLNLSNINIVNFRNFYGMFTDRTTSYQRYIRMMLDPRIAYYEKLTSPFVNNGSPFIPILTNNLVTLSGWPDLSVPVYTTDSGLYGEEMSMVDGFTNQYESFDLDATFRNTRGNPLIYMFYVWVRYMSLVFEGTLSPYDDMILENELDYNTRIYRLVTDHSRRYVTYLGACGAAMPLSVPTGSLLDYNTDKPYNDKLKEFSIRFKCNGYMMFDDVLKLKFNQTTAIFNPEIRKLVNGDMGRSGFTASQKERTDPTRVYTMPGIGYSKIPYAYMNSFDIPGEYNSVGVGNYKALPYINLYTNELEWWIDTRYFDLDKNAMPQAAVENAAIGKGSKFNLDSLKKSGMDLLNGGGKINLDLKDLNIGEKLGFRK